MAGSAPRTLGDGSRLGWAYFAVVVLTYMAVIMGARQPPPSVDYPDWVYQGVLFHGVLTGHPIPGYALKGYPVPNSLTTAALGLLDCAVPWEWAAKIWVCLYLGLAFAASRALALAGGREEWRMVVALPGVLFLNLDFWYGHISFEIGLCLLLLLVAAMLRERPVWIVGLLLTVLFFVHMEACACATLLLVVWCWRQERWGRMWATAPVFVLTAWYAAGRYTSGNIDGRSVTPAAYAWGSKAFLLYKANTFLKVFGYVNARAADGGSITEAIFGRFLFLWLLLAGCCLAMLCLWLVMSRDEAESWLGWRGTLRWLALALVVLAGVMPQVVLGVADPGSRLLLAAAAMAFLAVRWKRPTGTAAAVLGVVLCGVNLLQFMRVEASPKMAGAAKDLPGVVLGFGHVEPGERVRVYGKLRRGQMDEAVFQTGMFRIVGR